MSYFYDVMASFLIIVVFGIIFLGLALAAIVKDIEKNWPKYKCNPAIMPIVGFLGKDAGKNFTECVGDIQGGFMGYFLGPLRSALSRLSSMGEQITDSVNMIRRLTASLRNSIMNLMGNVFGIIMNVTTEFQLLLVNIKDLIMKLIGSLLTIAYFIQGVRLTGISTAEGPIGGLVGFFTTGDPSEILCFKKNTLLKLKNGKMVEMSKVNLGDILENGNEIIGVLRIKGNKDTPFYRIWSDKLNQYIYVTGTHLILDEETKKFIYVADYKKAEKTTSWDKELSCLVVRNNVIPIGEYNFWDWED